MQTVKLIAAILAIAALSGCKMNLTADLYSTDLRAAKAGEAGIAAPATLAFQVPSVDKCDEHSARVSEIMAGILDNFVPKGCKSEGIESFLLADTQMPLFVSEEAWQNSTALFGIILFDRSNIEHVGVGIVLDTEKYDILTNRMKEKFHQTVDLSNSRVTLVLNNDERNAVTFAVINVFVNSKPVLGEQEFKLNRRQKVDIVLSNVSTAFLAKKGATVGFTLRKSLKDG